MVYKGRLIPYLGFNGNCREALGFYKECLGGELTMQTFGETPMADQTPAEMLDKVMHGSLANENIVLFASDMMGEEADAPSNGRVTLCLVCRTPEEIRDFYAKLSTGGKIGSALKEEFFGTYGDFTDKFGIHWMLQYDNQSE